MEQPAEFIAWSPSDLTAVGNVTPCQSYLVLLLPIGNLPVFQGKFVLFLMILSFAEAGGIFHTSIKGTMNSCFLINLNAFLHRSTVSRQADILFLNTFSPFQKKNILCCGDKIQV